jgi:hypothetical protein
VTLRSENRLFKQDAEGGGDDAANLKVRFFLEPWRSNVDDLFLNPVLVIVLVLVIINIYICI